MPNLDGKSGATTHIGLTDDERHRVLKTHYKPSPVPTHLRAAEADKQPTILGREMVLRKLDAAKVAAKTGVHESRIEKIAAGRAQPECYERKGLEKLGLPADLLAAKNTADARREVNMRRPL